MTINASIGELVQVQFPCFDIDGITPLTGKGDSDFGKLLIVDNVISGVTMTVAEVGSTGRYVMRFTPDVGGLWYAEVTTEVEDIFADQVEVGPPPDDWIDAIVSGVWEALLPGSFPAGSAGDILGNVPSTLTTIETKIDIIDTNVDTIFDALILAVYTASDGAFTYVETDAVKADGFYDDLTVVVRNASGNIARRIFAYEQTDGTFFFDGDVPFVPAVGDQVIVLGMLGKMVCEGNQDLLAKLVEIWQRLGLDADNPLCISKLSQEANGWKIVSQEVGDKLILTREDV